MAREKPRRRVPLLGGVERESRVKKRLMTLTAVRKNSGVPHSSWKLRRMMIPASERVRRVPAMRLGAAVRKPMSTMLTAHSVSLAGFSIREGLRTKRFKSFVSAAVEGFVFGKACFLSVDF